MSFLQQLEGETPALTLEETLAFLDAFDYGSDDTTSGSSSSSNSPAFEDTETLSLDDEFGADSTATTAGSGSEHSCSDADDYYLSTLLSLPLESIDAAPVTPQTLTTATAGAAAIPPPTPPVKPQPQRTKRKAAASASSPKNASASTTTASDSNGASTTANGTKRRARKMPKTEILRLRDEVEELQARLTQLQKAAGGNGASLSSSSSASTTVARTSSSTAMTSRASSWLDSAVEQFKALQKAQTLNQKLKTEVSRQARLGNALKSMFTKKTAHQGMEFVMEMEPAKSPPAPTVSNPCDRGAWMPFGSRDNTADSEAETLYKSVESMQIETDSVQRAIAAESERDAVFSSSKTKLHREFGPVFELKTNTPVKHPNFHEVALLFWNRAVNSQSQNGTGATPDANPVPVAGVVTSQTFERPVTLRIQSSSGEVVLNGVSVMCRQDELERTAFTFAATLAVAGDSPLVFREHGWMIIAPHATDASQCVLQTFYRLDSEKRQRRMKQPAGSAAATPDAATGAPFSSELSPQETALRDIGIKALSENMRSFQSEVQSALLGSATGFDTSKLPRTCPLHNFKALLQG